MNIELETEIKIIDFQEGKRKFIRKIWDFLGQKFALNFPFPKIEIFVLADDGWKEFKRQVDRQVQKYGLEIRTDNMWNEKEKQVLRERNGDDLDADACLIIQHPLNKWLFEQFGNPDWIIFMADNKCDLPKNQARRSNIEEMGFNYYYFHILHEFCHIYERLSKKQLLNGDGEDLELIFEFMGWNDLVKTFRLFKAMIKNEEVKYQMKSQP